MSIYLSADSVGTSWTSLTDANGDEWQDQQGNVYRGDDALLAGGALKP